MLLCADEEAVAAALASGMLACPAYGSGRLRCWGWGRERAVRVPGGDAAAASPPGQVPVLRRDACPAPGLDGARRADSTATIASAAALSALDGTARLGVPAATVRGWLRRPRSRAGQLLQEASCEFGRLVAVIDDGGRDPSPPGPTGSVLGDGLALAAACARAAIRWHGRPACSFEALLGLSGLAAALAPAPGS
jgi:hypothetical protein